jgi:hypothetical protein
VTDLIWPAASMPQGRCRKGLSAPVDGDFVAFTDTAAGGREAPRLWKKRTTECRALLTQLSPRYPCHRSFLEAELCNCQAELGEAREDLERDEIIFADKMKELQVGGGGDTA